METCPTNSNPIEGEYSCECNDNKKIFYFRKEECVSCGDNSDILNMQWKKCANGSYSFDYDPYCYYINGVWNEIIEKCVNEKGEVVETNDEIIYGNFIKMYYGGLLFMVFILLF